MTWTEGRNGAPSGGYKLKALNAAAAAQTSVQGRLTGGNLTVLTCTLGTPFWKPWGGGLVFLEDTGEMWFRIDRMLAHLTAANAWTGVQGLVLGTYSGCRDGTTQVLRKTAKPRGVKELKDPPARMLEPLRPLIPDRKALVSIFSEWAQRAGDIPVWDGLNTGHGGGLEALPMGASARVEKAAGGFRMQITDWDWHLA